MMNFIVITDKCTSYEAFLEGKLDPNTRGGQSLTPVS